MVVKPLDFNDTSEVEASVKLVQNTHWGIKYSYDELLQAFKHSDSYVAIIDGHVIGFVRVLSDRLYMSYIFDMVISESQRNQGIGTAFISQVLVMGQYKKTVWYLATTNAQNFYKKLGFVVLDNTLERFMYCPGPPHSADK
jgi:ribosomal protein S18 acetylase RimI-like enzyme